MITSKDLIVFDTLQIDQLKVTPKRVKATYTLIKTDGSLVANELIYSYDQEYFDPKQANDINLASMMVAQVALNYGLFCKKIEFNGLYDATDKRLLIDMMENTSREILVHKFFTKNNFLKSPFDQIKPEKLDTYTAAEVIFRNSFSELTLNKEIATTQENDYAILSSGGKDSLLTYGIIKEIGSAHPVFINESGRHWFTAINAYKAFKEIEPNTVKPWCNSDRIFNWMVKQMPFIKENFQNIRADIYPIRLWTVAVFLFGVLPVARKRGLGNILIGNEYDTTIKGNHQGISHYHALYDQSKYFDNAMTRYYYKKGWNINQFSILRSLSELLILNILVKRYPDLQQHQVSCHAAHEQNGKMLPCGKCEKCRRIIGMLIALDHDPGKCGYTSIQISNGLKALSEQGIKQLESDAAHLYYLLVQNNHLPKNPHTNKLAKCKPQIMKLRFDNERSNLSDLPHYIRKPLIQIIKPYSEGMVQMKNKTWEPIEEKTISFSKIYTPIKQDI